MPVVDVAAVAVTAAHEPVVVAAAAVIVAVVVAVPAALIAVGEQVLKVHLEWLLLDLFQCIFQLVP